MVSQKMYDFQCTYCPPADARVEYLHAAQEEVCGDGVQGRAIVLLEMVDSFDDIL